MVGNMERRIDRGGLLGIGLVTALMIAIAVLNYRNTLLLYQNAQRVDEAHKILDLTMGIMLGLVDAETGERGYLLTFDNDFLRPYTDALPVIQQRMTKLKEMIKGNGLQQERLDKLEEMTLGRLALLKERIDLRRRRAPDRRIADAAMKGKDQMDAIRTLVAELEQEERGVLAERNRQSIRAYHIAITTGLLAAFGGLILLAAFVGLLNRSLTARQAAMMTMHQQRELFRTTLASIGDAVITTNNEGKVTFLNPVAEGMTGWMDNEAKGQPLETVFHIINEENRVAGREPGSEGASRREGGRARQSHGPYCPGWIRTIDRRQCRPYPHRTKYRGRGRARFSGYKRASAFGEIAARGRSS